MFCEWLRIFLSGKKDNREVRVLIPKKIKEARKWSWLKLDNKLEPAKSKKYITEEERKKCKIIAGVFNDLFKHEDLLVLDAGRYSFVKLQDYTVPFGFRYIDTFRNSHDLFEDLWEEWISSQLISLTLDSPLEYLNSDDILKSLPPQVMKRVNRKKRRLMKEAGLIPQKRKIKGI